MLCVTWTDSQNSTNAWEVNCDPWSECRINSPFRTGCDSNAFFRVRIARSLVICRSGYTGDNTSIMQIYDCTVVAYFMVLQKQIGKIGTPFLIDFICCKVLLYLVFKYFMRFAILIFRLFRANDRFQSEYGIHVLVDSCRTVWKTFTL